MWGTDVQQPPPCRGKLEGNGGVAGERCGGRFVGRADFLGGQCEEEAGGGLGRGGLGRLPRAEAVRGVGCPARWGLRDIRPVEPPRVCGLRPAPVGGMLLSGTAAFFSRFTVSPLIPGTLGMMDNRSPEVDKLDLRDLFPEFVEVISPAERHPSTIPPATYRSPPGNPGGLVAHHDTAPFPSSVTLPPQSSPGRRTARRAKAPELEEASPGGLENRRLHRRDPLRRGVPPGTPAFAAKIACPRATEEGGGQSALYPDGRSAQRLECGRFLPVARTRWDSGAIPTK